MSFCFETSVGTSVLCPIPRAAVRLLNLDDPCGRCFDPEILSTSEREKAARYLAAKDRDRFVRTRSSLRCILGDILGQPPDQVAIGYREGGKPFLEVSPDLHFNVSHAGGYALIAIAGQPIGVDIECHRPVDELAIAAMVFPRTEVDKLASRRSIERTQAFYKMWTEYEAVAKAVGDGIGQRLPPWVQHETNVQQLHLFTGYSGAVATVCGRRRYYPFLS